MTPTPDAAPGLDVRGAARRAVLFLVALALVAVALSALPGLDEVRERFASAAPAWLAAALLSEVASTASFPVALRGAFSRIMSWRPAFALGLVETGANVLVPAGGSGGLAFGGLVLQRRGVPAAFAATRTVVLFLATSLVTFVAIIVSGTAIALGADGGDLPGAVGAFAAAGAAGALVAVALIGRLPASVDQRPGRLRSLVARSATG
ncbi:MAG TPA: lysylphosphatidylglycerol synthase domain-containing protein [Solirubrobacteraceae bacterium]|nr:lysylphosphatidylglycerol synthase domain-containing protein [Solirubrobacteraceae bacterium]